MKNIKNKKHNTQNSEPFNVQFVNTNDNKGTMLEEFKRYIKTDDSAKRIIEFLALKNAQFLATMYESVEDIPNNLKAEILEFYLYFDENYGERTLQLRFDNWGEMDALILRVGFSILMDKNTKARNSYLKSLSKEVLSEATSLMTTIMDIRKDKQLTITVPSGQCQTQIPHTIPREFLEDAKQETLVLMAKVINESGAVVVRTKEKNHKFKVFGIMAYNQKWIPISKEEMLRCNTNNYELQPEENVIYTEIKKEQLIIN